MRWRARAVVAVSAACVLLAAAIAGVRQWRRHEMTTALTEHVVSRKTLASSLAAWTRKREPPLRADIDVEALRAELEAKVFLRGPGAAWLAGPVHVVDEGEVPDSATRPYTIRRLRFETAPGLWVPALVYEPRAPAGPVPVVVSFNGHGGHERLDMTAEAQQRRCLNLVHRGFAVVDVEWFGQGLLDTPQLEHGDAAVLDLVGARAVSPFIVAQRRAVDVALARPHADPTRVAVVGLSGGGWQALLSAALDPRVAAANPVAGFTFFEPRLERARDLGDTEQTPADLYRHVDYDDLARFIAPRPLLLTYNAADECCFVAEETLPSLVQAIAPAWDAVGASSSLRTHVNVHPGTHNMERDNREALYRFLNDVFAVHPRIDEELDVSAEVLPESALTFALPVDNAGFAAIARQLAVGLPETNAASRNELRTLLRARKRPTAKVKVDEVTGAGATRVEQVTLRVSEAPFPLAATVFGAPDAAVVVMFADAGAAALSRSVRAELDAGARVVVLELPFTGSAEPVRPLLWQLMVQAVGGRVLGQHVDAIRAVAAWQAKEQGRPVRLRAIGAGSSLAAIAAAALDAEPEDGKGEDIFLVETERPLLTLHQLLADDGGLRDRLALFTPDLLVRFDIADMVALAGDKVRPWP